MVPNTTLIDHCVCNHCIRFHVSDSTFSLCSMTFSFQCVCVGGGVSPFSETFTSFESSCCNACHWTSLTRVLLSKRDKVILKKV